MNTKTMVSGIAAAAAMVLIAAPTAASAAESPDVTPAVHVNDGRLTAEEVGAVTDVKFAPGAMADDELCFGPLVYAGQLTQEQIDKISEGAASGEGMDGVDASQFTAVLPDGLKDVLVEAGFYDPIVGQADGDENLAALTLSFMMSGVGTPNVFEQQGIDLPSGMVLSEDSNTFAYTLDGKEKYTAVGECFTATNDGEGNSTVTGMDIYVRTIGYDVGGGTGGTGGGDAGTGSLGSLFGSLSGSKG
ncbi:hypothetical protein [Tomitella fengzijianii]|uniref:Secreted protein n=1 Tax=Tomitella fengzijianii TaxID=2597660 RepID=A0A516X758_9ACTN|nr:hypothetical protein [Tomitella fengzijianii]QDQ98501.1 hypothetical protein FO059_15720 [Tomitella fengzijianii]